jgi:hypothetical protein
MTHSLFHSWKTQTPRLPGLDSALGTANGVKSGCGQVLTPVRETDSKQSHQKTCHPWGDEAVTEKTSGMALQKALRSHLGDPGRGRERALQPAVLLCH